MKQVITRFAPSPTGTSGMHIGNLRTALFSYLYAKQNNGEFILRIEDTDRERSNTGALEDIDEILSIMKITPDKRYIQSERLFLYQYYAHYLVHNGYAYICTCERGNEIECDCKYSNLEVNKSYCIKLDIHYCWITNKDKYGEHSIIKNCHDEIRNSDIDFKYEELYDIVLLKSDGYPTYHLGSIVDDHLMGITDVFRGDEWLSSFPYHVLLYTAFKWNMPRFYHLPLITNINGEKLSKRDGDFSVRTLLNADILPSTILNYTALLGWHPSGNDEIFDMDSLLKAFSIKRLSTSPACFDSKKLRKLNIIHAKTDVGIKEFCNKNNNLFISDIHMNRLCELFKTSGTLDYNNMIINSTNNIDLNINLLLLLNKYLPIIPNDCTTFLSDIEIDNIIQNLKNLNYSNKDIHETIRLLLINTTTGPTANVLLGLVTISYLRSKILSQYYYEISKSICDDNPIL